MIRERWPRTRAEWKRFLPRVIAAVFAIGLLYVAFLWITMPDIEDPASLLASQSTVITDRNGTELYRLYAEEDRTYIPIEHIPLSMQEAMIAIEDERFYDRGCLDILSIARVIILFGQAGGGSTITRQLARNALDLKNDSLVSRKLKEFVLGCQLENRYSKEELLELYLNWIPFGQNAYGIEQASQTYFGKSASGITLAESAILAALPQRPSYFSPYGNHRFTSLSAEALEDIQAGRIEKASQISQDDITIGLLGTSFGTGSVSLYVGGRTDQVLRNMQDQGYIEEQERLQALEELETITFQPSREDIRAAHFVLWVRDEVERLIGESAEKGIVERGGLKVETTLDWRLQEIAENLVASQSGDILNLYGAHNIALIAMDPETREVLAYVGNTNYEDDSHGGKIDMVLEPRQPGSSFKPFVYAAAFQEGFSPATPIYDVKTKIGEDEPQNYEGGFQGLMTMRRALGGSRNIPAAKTFFLAGGEEPILDLVTAMGAPTPEAMREQLSQERGEVFEYGWPLALGAAETPLIEMVQAYTTFADEGEAAPAVRIRRVTDKSGNILFEADEQTKKQSVLDPRIAYQITSVLSDPEARPAGFWREQLTIPGYQTAAKTGTSNKCMEWENENTCKLRKPDNAWVIGYTPNLVTGVWMGNADSSALYDKADGLNSASPLWKAFMASAHRQLTEPKTEFSVPDGIVQPQISVLSGELASPCTPVELRRADVFLEENAPSVYDSACAQLTIDKLTGLLASDSCPAEAREEGSFLVAHSIMADRWPQWEEGVQAWVAEQMALWRASENHSGSILPLPVAPEQECDIALTPGRLDRPEVQIITPQAGGTVSYPSFKPQINHGVGSSVREVIYEIDGKRVASVTEAPFDRALRVPRSIASEGSHTLTVKLIDAYFNEASDTVSFRFGADRNVPTVRFLEPTSSITVSVGDKLTMRVDAADPDGGLKYVQFFLGETLLTTKPTEPFELIYTVGVPPGIYDLRAVAEDLARNQTEDSVQVTVTE
jgi:membrane peptidoglycan carboxypeptidase